MLDLLDEKILSELDNDARISSTKIAKKLHVAKSVVTYRIKNMEKSGIIKRYYSVIDSYKLGYSSYRIYLKLKRTSPKKEREIIDFLTSMKQTRWVGLIKGSYNIGVVFLVSSQGEFVDLWNVFYSKYRDQISKYYLGLSCGLERFRLPFAKKHLKSLANVDLVQIGSKVEIDEIDSKILEQLSINGRIPLLELSQKIGLSPAAIQYRLNSLREKKVILGFRPIVNMEMLGYTLYKIDINLKTLSSMEKMRRFAREHENIFCSIKTLGWADVEFEVYANSTSDFYSILDQIRERFEDSIEDYDFFMYSELIKFRYTPY